MTWMNEDGAGGNGNDDAATAAAKIAAEAEANKAKPTDAEAKLLKEVMEKKEALKKLSEEATAAKEAQKALEGKLASFDGINLDEVKALLKEKSEREMTELEKKGEWERLRKQMAETNVAEVTKITTERDTIKAELTDQLTKAQRQITELTIGRSFSESPFIRESMTLTPAKTRIVYGSHFEIDNGKVVAYDKSTGSAERTMLVDATGNPLGFEAAIAKLVEIDPDRDNLLRSKIKNGAGSENDSDTKKNKEVKNVTGRDRIRQGLAQGTLKLPNAQ